MAMKKKKKVKVLEMKEGFSAQGDIYILAIDKLPSGLQKMKREDGKLIIAHSETGHHHSIFANDDAVNAFVMTKNPAKMFLDVRKPINLVHERDFDTHATIKFPVGTYQINRQREKRPDGWTTVQD